MLDNGWWSEVPPERRLPDSKGSNRAIPATYIVFHTTGSGVIQKALESGAKTEAQQGKFVSNFYVKMKGVSTHFLVDRDGMIWQMVPTTREAWHAGWSEAVKKLYGSHSSPSSDWQKFSQPVNEPNILPQSPVGGYAQWHKSFPGVVSPAQLIPEAARSPNNGSISIDLKAPGYKQDFTPEQIKATARLAAGLCTAMGVPSGRSTWFKHSELEPVRRGSQFTKVSGERRIVERLWDPPFDIDVLLKEV